MLVCGMARQWSGSLGFRGQRAAWKRGDEQKGSLSSVHGKYELMQAFRFSKQARQKQQWRQTIVHVRKHYK